MLSALLSALHVLGIALVATFSTMRLFALRREDVAGIRFADNGNGVGSLFLFGAGLARFFAQTDKPTAFYTENPVFWVKMGAIAAMVALELYPQWVVFPWHVRHARERPIEPLPGQIARMFRLAVPQLPLLVVVVGCAALMARGVGLPKREPPTAPAGLPGAAVYAKHCASCHQTDGRGLAGRVAADFVGDGSVLAQSDDVLLASITRGKSGRVGAMPPFGAVLRPEERRDVLAYVRSAFGQPPR